MNRRHGKNCVTKFLANVIACSPANMPSKPTIAMIDGAGDFTFTAP
jgi:hypothetical protein